MHARTSHTPSFSLDEINVNLPVQHSKHIFTFLQKRKNSLPLNPSKSIISLASPFAPTELERISLAPPSLPLYLNLSLLFLFHFLIHSHSQPFLSPTSFDPRPPSAPLSSRFPNQSWVPFPCFFFFSHHSTTINTTHHTLSFSPL